MDALLAGYGSDTDSDGHEDSTKQQKQVVAAKTGSALLIPSLLGAVGYKSSSSDEDDDDDADAASTNVLPEPKSRLHSNRPCHEHIVDDQNHQSAAWNLLRPSTVSNSMVGRPVDYLSCRLMLERQKQTARFRDDRDLKTILKRHKCYADYLRQRSDFHENPTWDSSSNIQEPLGSAIYKLRL